MNLKPRLKPVLTEEPSRNDSLKYYTDVEHCSNCDTRNVFYIEKGLTIKVAKRCWVGLFACSNCGCTV